MLTSKTGGCHTVKSNEANLDREWDERWQGSEDSERLTLLGRLMFKAKEEMLRAVLPEIEAETAIDVGCGLGYTLKVFHGAGLDCLGIDISPAAIKVCEQKGLPVRLQRLAEVTGQYDLVSSDGMLEHYLNFEPYAIDLMRLSRRYVLLIQPNHESLLGKTIVYLAELIRGHENMFEYNYRMKDFFAVFDKHGFGIVKNMPIFKDIFRLLLFEKSETHQKNNDVQP